ncbi:hypothetical protein [Streptomyces canus]|uniref:hypothetical protein n=1 Tax=Streptomyces canus TaxID=58343 RepID=UPI002783B1EE|nr:hypothetical protein [Streptomyces canus]MDQ0762047.1 hypothetical protein [Streptomyces canus]
MSEPDEGETKVRAALHRLGARSAGHAPAGDAERQPAPVPVRPEYEPTVPGPRRACAPRLPDWWNARKPELETDDAQEDDEQGESPASVEQHDDGDDLAEGRRPRLRKVSKQPDADDIDEPDDLGEEDAEAVDEDAGEGQPRKRAARWRRSHGETTRPPFATAVPLYREAEKVSLAELIRHVPAHKKWLLYIGTGFGAGWYFGVPQFVRDATASVAQHEGRLQDNPDVYFWGVVALVVISLDRRARHSWFLIAWVTRGLTVCLILGALLYGNPLPH